MGGFFLLCRPPEQPSDQMLSDLLAAFAETGFKPPEIISTDAYIFAAYAKYQTSTPALKRYQNGDFVFVCGTCLSREGIGAAAADALYHAADLDAATSDLMGHYAIVIRKAGQTTIRTDRFGAYHVYYNIEKAVISSSFYAISSMLPQLTVSVQSAYEYVFNGVVSGNESLFDEIRLIPIEARAIVKDGHLSLQPRQVQPPSIFDQVTYDQALRQSVETIDRYFERVVRLFGDRVQSALSGGYDSRLILAFFRRHGVAPQLYVYGNPLSADVQLAVSIAKGEGLEIAPIDKDEFTLDAPEEIIDTIHRNFLGLDGYGHAGIFNNGAELRESSRRVAGNSIAVNGGGGEIFRNFFYLPNREYTTRHLLWTFYSQFDPTCATALLNVEEYYRNLEQKIFDVLGQAENPHLARPTIEWLYHRFRCRSWDGKVDTVANRYGHTGMPFLENIITEHASRLRISWKNHGTYEAKLIELADPRLAAYPSIYGHNFVGAPPLSRRVRDAGTYLRPPWLRQYSYRLKARMKSAYSRDAAPQSVYYDLVLPGGPQIVQRLFRLEFVRHPLQYVRILSLEYALRHFGRRVRFDC